MRRVCAVALIVSAVTVAGATREPGFTFPRSAPEAQGISSSAILAFVEEAEQKIDALHSVMLVRHGQVVAEGWWAPYAADEPHMLFSLSKSFTSTAVGLAVAEGKLSVDDPVLGFFPDEAPAQPSATCKRDARPRSADDVDRSSRRGHPGRSRTGGGERRQDVPGAAGRAQAGHVLRLQHARQLHAVGNRAEGHGPGRARLPAPAAVRAARHREPDLGGEPAGRLDGRLRIERAHRGHRAVRPALSAEGQWQGKQLLPASWVETATARQMSNGSSPASDWEQGYGYQFWRSRHGFYRGDGAHGQFCLVLPQYDTVVAITSGTRDMGSVMNLVWDRLVPALRAVALPADRRLERKLSAKLASLTLPPQTGAATSPQVKPVAGDALHARHESTVDRGDRARVDERGRRRVVHRSHRGHGPAHRRRARRVAEGRPEDQRRVRPDRGQRRMDGPTPTR